MYVYIYIYIYIRTPLLSLDGRPHIWKKGISNFACVVHIFSFTNISYFKKFIGIKALNTKQCLVSLSHASVSSLLTKDSKIKWF